MRRMDRGDVCLSGLDSIMWEDQKVATIYISATGQMVLYNYKYNNGNRGS